MNTTQTTGTQHLIARAAKDSRVAGLLQDVYRYGRRGDYVLQEQALKTLDDYCQGDFSARDAAAAAESQESRIARAKELRGELADAAAELYGE
jgi:hypothetical protein